MTSFEFLTHRMRALWLAGLLLWVSGSHSSLTEACLFVGARFARTHSTCDGGLCPNLFQSESRKFTHSSLDGSPVTCAEARDAVREFLAEMPCPVRRSRRMRREEGDAPELIRLLRNDINPLIRRLAFGADLDTTTMCQRLEHLDERSSILAATNPTEWRETTVSALMISAELAELGVNIIYAVRSDVSACHICGFEAITTNSRSLLF